MEKTRMISEKISNHMSRKQNEIKFSLDSQIQDAVTTAIVEKVLASIQNTLGEQGRGDFNIEDRVFSGLQRSELGKITPKQVPLVKIKDKCLDRFQ